MKKILLFVAGLVLFATVNPTFAQSSDRDHPTPLTSNEIRGNVESNKDEHFYSFTAGPGELTITADIAGNKDSGTLSLAFELLDKNAANALLCCEGVQGDFGGTGREVKSVKLTKRQTVILHTTSNEANGSGTFRFRLSGASLSGGSAQTGGNGETVENNRSVNRNGNQITVPAKGTLLIRMKDGSTKEIDLSLVREISVQP
ncbi:MAG: hypothetical protein ABI954_02310 [Pyrinomonadaceae bacterium]